MSSLDPRRSWLERRQRRAAAWWGARFHALPRGPQPVVALFCDFEGHFAGPQGGQFADAGTDVLLAMLARLDLRITFNIVADLCDSHPQRVQRIAAAGHEIACHGWRHERPRELSNDQINAMLRAARDTFGRLNLRPIGFRAPESAWSMALMRRLPAHGFRWSAERDTAAGPYEISTDVVRVPVTTDDWDLAEENAAVAPLLSKWETSIAANAQRGGVIGLGMHEWIVGRNAEFAQSLETLLARIQQQASLRLTTLGQAAGITP